ncbi:SPRY domain-containing SOCS box protein 2 isoform X2 [Arvicanthis niloticus]|uniref:SPRY domain-containing SOCS box protein 2 isoform X2 n=1 Tax=Arvicanthis niloticus TaxID=61156 RepID=UPI00402B3218
MGGRAGHAAVRKLRKNKLKSLTPRSPGRDKRLATQSVLHKACALVHIWSRHVFFAWILCSRGRSGAQLSKERRPSKPVLRSSSAAHLMGQTALARGSSSTPTSQALYSDFSPPEGLEELLSASPPDLGAQRSHGWNPKDCSENIDVKEGGLCFERRPVAQSTDGVRGKQGYSKGLHAWEISWPLEQRGTHAVVGVATALAPLQADHYAALLGSNSESWGWDIGRGKLYHQSKGLEAPQYPAGPQGEQLVVPERLLVVLDMEEGTLGYSIGGTYLGPAFRGLKGRTLYPSRRNHNPFYT